jgi:hypothetical protein
LKFSSVSFYCQVSDTGSVSLLFSYVRDVGSLVFCVMFCRSLWFCPFSFDHGVVCPLITASASVDHCVVCPLITASDYPFGIFRLFILKSNILVILPPYEWVSEWVSEWLLFNANSAISPPMQLPPYDHELTYILAISEDVNILRSNFYLQINYMIFWKYELWNFMETQEGDRSRLHCLCFVDKFEASHRMAHVIVVGYKVNHHSLHWSYIIHIIVNYLMKKYPVHAVMSLKSWITWY